MTEIKKGICVLLAAAMSLSSGGLMAADSALSKGANDVSATGKPAANATIGVLKPEQKMNAEDLKWVLGECKWQINNTTRFASLTSCIAALDPSTP